MILSLLSLNSPNKIVVSVLVYKIKMFCSLSQELEPAKRLLYSKKVNV